MDKIRVLHILYSFDIGGLEKGVAMLINHGSPDFEHRILCLTRSGDSQKLIPPETPIYEIHKPPGNSIRFLWRLAKAIRDIQPDVVHTRNWSGMDGILAARLAGCHNIVHGEHGWGMDDPVGRHPKRKLIRRALSMGTRELTAVSQQIKDWLENEVLVPRPVTQIYNGVEISTSQGLQPAVSIREELGLPDSALLAGTVGRLDPIKDHAGLIRSFQDVHHQLPNCHLVLVGDGPERKKLEQLRTENVYLLGMRNDVPSILQQLDLFILPSLNEGISNTILEAMAAGLAVVATAVGGTPELIRHEENGLLVSAQDYPALSGAMVRYLNNAKLRIVHGERNRCLVFEKFSIPAMVAGYEMVWRRVTGMPEQLP